jgi:hypothetical protein
MTSSNVRAALELRKKMREHRRLSKAIDADYRELDLQYEDLVQNFNVSEQKEFIKILEEVN